MYMVTHMRMHMLMNLIMPIIMPRIIHIIMSVIMHLNMTATMPMIIDMTEILRESQRDATYICAVLELEPMRPSQMIVRMTMHTRFPASQVSAQALPGNAGRVVHQPPNTPRPQSKSQTKLQLSTKRAKRCNTTKFMAWKLKKIRMTCRQSTSAHPSVPNMPSKSS